MDEISTHLILGVGDVGVVASQSIGGLAYRLAVLYLHNRKRWPKWVPNCSVWPYSLITHVGRFHGKTLSRVLWEYLRELHARKR